jgi:hypothetical protein
MISSELPQVVGSNEQWNLDKRCFQPCSLNNVINAKNLFSRPLPTGSPGQRDGDPARVIQLPRSAYFYHWGTSYLEKTETTSGYYHHRTVR